MKKYIFKYAKYIFIVIYIIMTIATYNIGNKKYSIIFLDKDEKYISVYVKGNVKEEKTLKVKQDTTIQEAIDLCGGIKENSDISKIDLKAKVKPGDIIQIPVKVNNNKDYVEDREYNKDKVNINSADKNTLMNLTGIGEKTAEKIIEYRKENKFESIADVKNVSGIGEKKYEKIKNEITI